MLKQLPINTDNFLRFFDTATPTINDTKFIKTTNNGYDYKWRQFCFPLPIAVGDNLNFYTNFSTNLVGSNSISIIVDNQIVVDATKYVLSVASVGTNNKLISLSIPLASTGARQKFSLGITSGASILYRSNDFYVIGRDDKSLNNTHLLKFFNDTNVFNYEWGDLDKEADPYYTVRIPSSVYEFGYPKEDTIYKSATSGKPRKTRAVLSKSVVFESYFVDEELHDAVNYALNSNNLFINKKEFVMESGYEVAFNKNSNVHKGTATLLEKNYGARLNNC